MKVSIFQFTKYHAGRPDVIEWNSKAGEAKSLLHQALKGRQRKLSNNHPACLESTHELAVLHKEQAKYQEAGDLYLEANEGRRLKLGDTHPHTLESWNNLIILYEAWGKPEKTKEWRAKLLQTKAAEE